MNPFRSPRPGFPRARFPHALFLCALLACALLLAGCAHTTPATTPKGFSESRSTSDQLSASLKPQRWAVVIGVNRYQDPTFGNLEHAVDDAQALARVLRDPKAGGFDRVVTLTSTESTTRDSILFSLRRLRFELRRQDTFVLYFSGHGTLEYTPTGQPLLYLVAADTRSGDLFGTGIDLTALRAFLDELKPQRKVLVLDSCFSGEGKSRISAVTRDALERRPAPWSALSQALSQSEAVLMASTPGGVAQEDNRLGHGVYTHALLGALTQERARADINRDGAVTVYEAHDFARARTVDHTKGSQVPDGYFRVLGRAEIYLAGQPDPAMAKNAALVYAYGVQNGMRLEIDGRLKGTFPQTVAVDPGSHRVTVRDDRGRVVADGRLRFAHGQTWEVETLLEEVRGYRRLVALETGGALQVQGPVVDLWGRSGGRVGLMGGYRVRGGALYGLTLSGGLGWTPVAGGAWTGLTEADRRDVIDLSIKAVLRRPVAGRFQAGVGWQSALVWTPPLAASLPSSGGTAPEQLLHGWLSVPGGPVLWQGLEVHDRALITLEQWGSVFLGAFENSGGLEPNLRLSFTVGLELGF